MSRTILVNLLRFIALIFVQVFLLKNTGYYNLAVPFIYILIILLLPFGIPNILLFSASFLTGICIDAFYDSPGVHAAACTVLALVRVIFINLTVQREGFENEPDPGLSNMGFRWFFFYALMTTIFHHATLFLLETFNFASINYTLVRIVFSVLLTIMVMLVYEFIFSEKKARK
jgi:hypothetical protein